MQCAPKVAKIQVGTETNSLTKKIPLAEMKILSSPTMRSSSVKVIFRWGCFQSGGVQCTWRECDPKLILTYTLVQGTEKICFGPGGLHAPHITHVGPGVLACATRGGGRSEAGHCFHLLFSSSFFFFFLSPPSTFHPLRGISRAWKFVSPNILA